MDSQNVLFGPLPREEGGFFCTLRVTALSLEQPKKG